jgi:hypothetical protein
MQPEGDEKPDVQVFKGSCPCEALTYSFTYPASEMPKQAICHCNLCKRISGASFTRSTVIPMAGLTTTTKLGTKMGVYERQPWRPSKADGSTMAEKDPGAGAEDTTAENQAKGKQPGVRWTFCTTCGGQIYSENQQIPGMAIVRVGTLERHAEITETIMQLFCKRHDGWLKELDGLEVKFDEMLPGYGEGLE